MSSTNISGFLRISVECLNRIQVAGFKFHSVNQLLEKLGPRKQEEALKEAATASSKNIIKKKKAFKQAGIWLSNLV